MHRKTAALSSKLSLDYSQLVLHWRYVQFVLCDHDVESYSL